jgi:DNA-binding beta-propeller fold protein YncE
MKKTLSALAAITISALATNPASAALTTALPGGQTLWVMNTQNGNFNELDPIAGTVTPVFATSTVSSNSWVVGADYDPATNAVYWIKNFDSEAQAIVRFDVATETETVFVTAALTLSLIHI